MSKPKTGAIWGSDHIVGESWTATMNLRWKKTGKMTYGMFANPDVELQQMWRSDKGEEKWERIEHVD